ncbi:uncharacterized protein LY89DRAFT_724715 [Mollisia scopiformis]|uniref:Uncharacterized protein n=1 Tax=Mollisia scopiformis TaxID=149040 RepID=A0A132B8D4_MOLSC|nr:uncharacterized protein LY89DRAFT_724715 [Mollisia scopiformis]KUJ08668.1 hypothetical protein LY89DRAFT_724715 [Mollisia scopiformis]
MKLLITITLCCLAVAVLAFRLQVPASSSLDAAPTSAPFKISVPEPGLKNEQRATLPAKQNKMQMRKRDISEVGLIGAIIGGLFGMKPPTSVEMAMISSLVIGALGHWCIVDIMDIM